MLGQTNARAWRRRVVHAHVAASEETRRSVFRNPPAEKRTEIHKPAQEAHDTTRYLTSAMC